MAASLELAITAIRSGRREEGRQLLNLLIQQNPNDDMAWLWMSSVVDADEQRARCLYHVLAINPDSQIARRGLQVLGIVVSDSRPVKVPRDSQPIHIPKPSPPQAAPVAEAASQEERRPFLIDPETITQELPFTPLKAPFQETPLRASPSILAIDVEESGADVNGREEGTSQESDTSAPAQRSVAQPLQDSAQPTPVVSTAPAPASPPSEPVPVVGADATQQMPSTPPTRAAQPQQPSEPVPVVGADETQQMPAPPAGQSGQLSQPSEPVPVVHSSAEVGGAPQPQVQSPQGQYGQQIRPDTGQLQAASPGQLIPLPGQTHVPPNAGPLNPNTQTYYSPQPAPPNQQSLGEAAPSNVVNETRPSQPVPVTHSNVNMGLNQPGYYPVPQPPAGYANVPMGMPAQYPQPPYPSQPMSPIHSNTTTGMPLPLQSGQPQHPSEPVPVIHSNSTIGMTPSPYGQAQVPQSPESMAFHSNSTMMMPTMTEAEARARLAASQAMPALGASSVAPPGTLSQFGAGYDPVTNTFHPTNNIAVRGGENEEDEREEINIMAVIIFGSLSVTALGGLGMLILLMFTTPAV